MAFAGVVKAPVGEPVPFGLLSVAAVQDETADEHWANGLSVETELCTARITIEDVCSATVPSNVVVDGAALDRWFAYRPFEIKAEDVCSAFGIGAVDRFERVQRQLLALTPKAVERELWEGVYAKTQAAPVDKNSLNNPYLVDGTATVLGASGTTPVAPADGLALLEGALSGLPQRGTIHMTRHIASLLDTRLIIQKDDELKRDVVTTRIGTLVAAGSGYTGSSSAGLSPAGSQWMYATGPVAVWLGAPQVVPESLSQGAIDTSVNTIMVTANRPAAVYYYPGCGVFAVQVTTPGST